MDTEQTSSRPVGINLDALTVQQLTELIVSAESVRTRKLAEAKEALLQEFGERAAAMGLSPDIFLTKNTGGLTHSRKPPIATSLPVKFRGPNGEEWSGRGRLPNWLRLLEAEGRKRDEFRV